jgi:hypothetical protein
VYAACREASWVKDRIEGLCLCRTTNRRATDANTRCSLETKEPFVRCLLARPREDCFFLYFGCLAIACLISSLSSLRCNAWQEDQRAVTDSSLVLKLKYAEQSSCYKKTPGYCCRCCTNNRGYKLSTGVHTTDDLWPSTILMYFRTPPAHPTVSVRSGCSRRFITR